MEKIILLSIDYLKDVFWRHTAGFVGVYSVKKNKKDQGNDHKLAKI